MKGRGFGQDDFGGYRFQLAYMNHALALTHLHRLPAAPGLFKPTFERLFEKLLLPEVWTYWHDACRGGTIWNRHLSDLGRPPESSSPPATCASSGTIRTRYGLSEVGLLTGLRSWTKRRRRAALPSEWPRSERPIVRPR